MADREFTQSTLQVVLLLSNIFHPLGSHQINPADFGWTFHGMCPVALRTGPRAKSDYRRDLLGHGRRSVCQEGFTRLRVHSHTRVWKSQTLWCHVLKQNIWMETWKWNKSRSLEETCSSLSHLKRRLCRKMDPQTRLVESQNTREVWLVKNLSSDNCSVSHPPQPQSVIIKVSELAVRSRPFRALFSS